MLLEWWYRALNSTFGIVIKTNDPLLLRQKLYLERSKAKDPTLQGIILAESRKDPSGELWLVKKLEQKSAEEVGPSD